MRPLFRWPLTVLLVITFPLWMFPAMIGYALWMALKEIKALVDDLFFGE